MQYILVNIQILARAHGVFLNERYVRLCTLKLKHHQVVPIFIKEGGIGDS
jgi:hypothetical protein